MQSAYMTSRNQRMKGHQDNCNTLQHESARLRRAESILLGLADTVSRGRSVVDMPRELRRIAAELRDGAQRLQAQAADCSGPASLQQSFIGMHLDQPGFSSNAAAPERMHP